MPISDSVNRQYRGNGRESHKTMDDKPKFGKKNKAPPSFFARVPSSAVTDKRLTDKEFRVLCVLCSYANNQGFAYPNSKTIGDLFGLDRKNVTRALTKCEKLGYIEKVSKFRSHPKWRHVMGTVWRIVYDDRLDQDELIDSMNKEDPPPVMEEDLPQPEIDAGKHEVEGDGIELVDVVGVARWYARKAEEMTGQLKLINERALEQAKAVIDSGITEDQVKVRALAVLQDCQQRRKPAPDNLGFLVH